MACDADLIPIALGTQARCWTSAAPADCHPRDLAGPGLPRRHCAFPGCTRPPVMGHAHHIVHWADHGETSLENLVLLCGHHHRTIHHTPWQVRLNPTDGKPEFLPPQRPGAPPPTWIRSRRRRE
ncbi:HNH endonuclease signature motif containing protein [Nocardioides ungokensis]|uniref:HNH endonuclease signature motif containing protein n=1 Tax=Nocardioides ungokensis TaxID=1643322 RepID=UPI002483C616|nr:HNH endonuclease signature motif containing protein [Nocardioides ungokensis]